MAFNILIVDDSATLRTMVKRTLTLSGLSLGELYEAGSGIEALALLEKEWVDLVLADINMPGMDGYEMTRRMSQKDTTKNIPVIVVSTEASTARIEELKQFGVKGYVHKPFTPEKIKDAVLGVLGVCHAENTGE